MQRKFKQVFLYFCVLSLALTTFFVFGMGKTQASGLPEVQFSDLSTTGLENSPSHPIRVYLSEASLEDVTVDYFVTGGTAIENQDYLLSDDSIQIEKGQTYADISLSLIDNQIVSGPKDIEISLSSPVNASLGKNIKFSFEIVDDDFNPITSLTVVPEVNDGQNGWYITKPQFQLVSEAGNQIFYSINGNSWTLYQDLVTVDDGVSAVSYFAEDIYGNQEPVKTYVFKVDTVEPILTNFSVNLNSQEEAILSWDESSDIATYQIWHNDGLVATLPSGSNSFTDQGLIANQNYEYYIVMIDQAGNQTISDKFVVFYVIKEEIKEVKGTQTEVKPLPKISKNIGIASSTTDENIDNQSAQIDTSSDLSIAQLGEENVVEESSVVNWNRWLLIISILIIMFGVGIGLYYGYVWFLSMKEIDSNQKEKKSKSRW